MRGLLVTLFTAALLGWLAAAALGQTSIGTKRIGVGPNPTMPDGSSVRLQGLLTTGGTEFVVLDAEGDGIRRLLAAGDIPSVFPRRDLPESISALWQFGAGLNALAASSFTSATFSSTIGVTGLATLTAGYAAGASSSIAGNLTLSGNGRRLLGDFSTATVANRASVQSTTTNGATHLQALPNGTSTTASFVAANAATPTNAAIAQLLATSTEASLRADRFGSGSYLPLTFHAGGAERFRFSTDGTGVVQPTTTLRTNDYASGTSGWAITGGGDADFRRGVFGELQTKSYIADLEQALNGGQIVSKSNAFVAQAFTCPAPGGTSTLWVRDYPSAADMRVFAAGDWVVLRIHARADSDADGNLEMSVADCVGVVTGYGDQVNGLQTWTFTRAAAPNGGSASTGAVIPVETIALDFGTVNTGLLETTVLDGAEGSNSPYLQIFTWATSPIVSNRTVRTRLGKLTGLTGTANEFGLLAGAYAATDGRYLRASNAAFELHGVDLTIWDGSTQAFLLRRNSGAPYFSIGSPAPTTFGSGVGFWAGDDGGTYKVRIGNPAGNRLSFDTGTGVLTVAGEGSGVTNISGGNIQTGSIDATRLSVTAGGANRVINSSCEADSPADGVADGWSVWSSGGGVAGRSGTGPLDASWACVNAYTGSGTQGLVTSTASGGGVKGGWKPGTTYVVSFWAKVSTALAQGAILGWNTPPASVVALSQPNLSTSWQRYVFRVTWGPGAVEGDGRLYIGASPVPSATNVFWLDAVKVEEGDVLGGYAPAPEEILPGSITADRLAVSSLSAITATLGSVTAGTITSSTITSSTLASTGNWELSDANGLLLYRGTSSSGFTGQRSIRFMDGVTERATIGMWTDNGLRISVPGVAAGGGIRQMVGNDNSGLFITFEADANPSNRLVNIVAQGQSATVSTDVTVQFVPFLNGLGGATLSRIGNAALPWSQVFATQFYAGATPGFTGTKVVGSCTFTMNGGLVTNVTGC